MDKFFGAKPIKASNPFKALVNDAKFQSSAVKSGTELLHNFIWIKVVISLVILVGAIVISALYNKTKKGDVVAKNKLKYTSALWFGEQHGMMGTMVILWLPTLLFFIALQFANFDNMVSLMRN